MNILKYLRKKKGLTQKQLALDLKIPRHTIADYETNRTEIDDQNIFRMAELFECSPALFLSKNSDQLEEKCNRNEKVVKHNRLETLQQFFLMFKL